MSQEKFSIHGIVKSAQTQETIIAATISVASSNYTTASNEYGFYSLTLEKGNYILTVSSAGMRTRALEIQLDSNIQLEILLEPQAKDLDTVVLSSTTPGRSLRAPQMSVEKLSIEEIRHIPVIFGERDVLKTLQLLPGVKQASEGNSGFYVRGGGADQNLILLDEAPVYNASHLLGFFSTFNSDAIKNVTLYKGGMPAQYGGRLSSVVDIRMNDGNMKNFGVSGGIGLISSRLNVEGPLQKERSSFLLAGRRTYADIFLKLAKDSVLRGTRLYFYDLNTKMNFIPGKKDRIFFSGYFGRDVLSQENLAGINWGNITGTLRWNHIFNSRLFSNTSFIFSNYDYKININTETTDFRIFSQIRDWNLKYEMQWYANSSHTVSGGLNSIFHTIKPGEISTVGSAGNFQLGLPDRYSLENAAHISDTWRVNDRWNLTLGLRATAFMVLGKGDYYELDGEGRVIDTMSYERGEIVKTWVNAEPRAAMSFLINPISSVKASYTRNTQNLHLISNTTSLSPTDKWVASSNIIRPEVADQFALGYYRDLGTMYELSVESYYKWMQNQIDYRNGAEIFTNEPIETQLLYGVGRAYGIEVLLRKRRGKLTGWMGYTLSKTERKINGVNDDKWYNARQDRTHDLTLVGILQLNKKWTLSATWIYYTGDAVTYPAGKYIINDRVFYYYTDRNSYRMPDYHRLDLGATLQLKKRKRFSSELNFSIFNAYGRYNAYQIEFEESEEEFGKTIAVQTSLFSFVPSISYNFKF
jgi:hypothetical protein